MGCDESFQPLKENDRYFFSIQGYLDVSADTQWVRITPARQQLVMPPVTPEMHVTLEELESGNITPMNDSLFIQANGFHYLNFWTTMEIKPEHTYRLTAEDSLGNTSHVEVTTPEEFRAPTIQYIGEECYARMDVYGWAE